MAHQHLAQLKKAGEDIYHAVMTDAKTKVIFGGLSAEDARILAEQVFLGELDLEEPKGILNKPVVTGYIRTWLENHSRGQSSTTGHTTSTSRGKGDSWGTVQGETIRVSQEFLGDDTLVARTNVESSGGSNLESETEGHFSSSTRSKSWGQSETLEPILEERPSQVFGLEEQIYKGMAIMVNQPMRHAIIKLPKQQTQIVQTPYIKEGYARDERIDLFKKKCFQVTEFIKPVIEVERQIEERHRLLELQAKRLNVNVIPSDPKDFKEEPQKEPKNFRD